MALVTAQKRQTLRLPTPDASVDSIDKLALVGVWQVESEAASVADNIKRWVLRLPIIDASVDELDAWGILQLPQSGGAGNTTDSFELGWFVDPTWTTSEPAIEVTVGLSVTLGGFSSNIVGIVGDRPAGGGFGAESWYNAQSQQEKDEKERLKRIRAEIRRMNRWR